MKQIFALYQKNCENLYAVGLLVIDAVGFWQVRFGEADIWRVYS
jgi:hypothetical protein